MGRFFVCTETDVAAFLDGQKESMIFNRSNVKLGRLSLSEHCQPNSEPPVGVWHMGLDNDRDAVLYVPASYTVEKPSSFVLLLHGAGGSAEHGLFLLKHFAEKTNMILLAPSSRGGTWDIIEDGVFDLDVLFINHAMEIVCQAYSIDRNKMAVSGFSDGASYALSLGLINGELFTHVIAFSPGFFHAPTTVGRPKLFISHGTTDTILPIASCSRRIVPRLQREGYQVTYHEFHGGHVIPENISEEAVRWFL